MSSLAQFGLDNYFCQYDLYRRGEWHSPMSGILACPGSIAKERMPYAPLVVVPETMITALSFKEPITIHKFFIIKGKSQ